MSENDALIIRKQLGREPDGALSIAKRCCHGFPSVVECSPVTRNRPFPTVFWLTCPYLRLILDRMEEQGGVKTLSRKISSTPSLYEEYLADTRWYIEYRINLFSRNFPGKTPDKALSEKGIGGISSWRECNLKCLHMHAAMFMASGRGIAGKLVMDGIRSDCEDCYCGQNTGS